MPTIAYLDDDRIQHILMKKLFQIHLPSFEVQTFSKPNSMEDWLGNNVVDIILSDLNLEGESAWDWIERFTKISSAPLVFLTAHATPEDLGKMADFPQVKMIFEKPLAEDDWQKIAGMVS
ncbi:response regulator receiver domain-containing protein [Algoriphagus boseongensis]|uniref:Response regulator receiver domain-containing protein n=1 Tax=Algoriphagus boseongensis TaxID=1442587 RepID=A0A4R6TAA5_9BACT|nr:response regulator [Algoriphagus boseongensis]TDQ19706.1 response regulator receiver domain-containing protein [Algoriphagus boseongensis]